MKFSRILGVAAALAVAPVMAQEAATVSAAPEAEPAPVTALETDDSPATWGDAAAGAAKAAVCAACHGMDGNAADPQYPKLAGQHEQYIARQLALFKSGERQNAIMLGFAATLSAQDMRDIGAHYASQKALPGVADDSVIADGPNAGRKFYEVGQALWRSGDADRGIPACQACHGPAGAGVPGTYPAIAGQHAAYTALQLKAFRDGQVWGQGDRANAVMAGVAARLTDEEIQALASFAEGLHHIADAAEAGAVAQGAKE
ncbi:c-type cytochrome [Arenimonas fontis]|uniref:Cytochrome c4 n=1 Tax=Arenimonas fontis TaxID=2608255 RepID=A0A5B2Z9X2_9GAMM|nr:c-type cytochrome [Arenimonas fontis]KAA2284004.1 cytochrome c4 [Arenimonas fontis]